MSISQAKIEANRRNAQRSTGPRTDEGKARAAMNAVRHGVCAKNVCVRGEESGEFETMLAQFLEEHDPQSGTEFALVYRLAMATWNLRRLTEAETEYINQHTLIYHRTVPRLNAPDDPPPTPRAIGESMLSVVGKDSKFGLLQIYQSRLERTFYRALSELRRIKKDETAKAQATAAADDEIDSSAVGCVSDTPFHDTPGALEHDEHAEEVEVEQTNPPRDANGGPEAESDERANRTNEANSPNDNVDSTIVFKDEQTNPPREAMVGVGTEIAGEDAEE